LFGLLLLPRILEEFRWHPAGGNVDPFQLLVRNILDVLALLAGWPLWKTLRKEKHSSIRQSVVTVMGYLPIQVLFLLPFFTAAATIELGTNREIGRQVFIMGLAVSSFFGGCWIGFKKTRLTLLWLLLGFLFFWVPFTIEGISWNLMAPVKSLPYIKALFLFACVAAGGYFGRWIASPLPPSSTL